jgi:hypothetical protein
VKSRSTHGIVIHSFLVGQWTIGESYEVVGTISACQQTVQGRTSPCADPKCILCHALLRSLGSARLSEYRTLMESVRAHRHRTIVPVSLFCDYGPSDGLIVVTPFCGHGFQVKGNSSHSMSHTILCEFALSYTASRSRCLCQSGERFPSTFHSWRWFARIEIFSFREARGGTMEGQNLICQGAIPVPRRMHARDRASHRPMTCNEGMSGAHGRKVLFFGQSLSRYVRRRVGF